MVALQLLQQKVCTDWKNPDAALRREGLCPERDFFPNGCFATIVAQIHLRGERVLKNLKREQKIFFFPYLGKTNPQGAQLWRIPFKCKESVPLSKERRGERGRMMGMKTLPRNPSKSGGIAMSDITNMPQACACQRSDFHRIPSSFAGDGLCPLPEMVSTYEPKLDSTAWTMFPELDKPFLGEEAVSRGR